jgi:hypothetical protein
MPDDMSFMCFPSLAVPMPGSCQSMKTGAGFAGTNQDTPSLSKADTRRADGAQGMVSSFPVQTGRFAHPTLTLFSSGGFALFAISIFTGLSRDDMLYQK